jgi:dUTP pyrophosphatase
MVEVKFKLLNDKAYVPIYTTPGSAGADLKSVEEVIIPTGQVRLVRLGFAVAIPEGYEIQVRSRSGLALKNGVMVLNSPGTVDSDYRGEMGVILANFGPRDFVVLPGDRIAQMVLNKVEKADFGVVEELDKTERGENGFGSSGVRS